MVFFVTPALDADVRAPSQAHLGCLPYATWRKQRIMRAMATIKTDQTRRAGAGGRAVEGQAHGEGETQGKGKDKGEVAGAQEHG